MASLLRNVGAALVVVVVLLGYNWTALTGWQVRCDLRDYSQAIRRAECGIAEKERLLDQVEKIDDDLRRGRCIGWLRCPRQDSENCRWWTLLQAVLWVGIFLPCKDPVGKPRRSWPTTACILRGYMRNDPWRAR